MIVLAVLMMLLGLAAVAGLVALALGTGAWWLFLMLPIGFMPAGFGWGLFRTLRAQQALRSGGSRGPGDAAGSAMDDGGTSSAVAYSAWAGRSDPPSSRHDQTASESIDHATRYGSDVGSGSSSDGAASSGDSGSSASSGTD